MDRASAAVASPRLDETRLAELVAAEVARRLPEVVEASLVGALATIAQEHMAVAVDAAVARALPDVLEAAAFGMGPQVEAALANAAREAVKVRLEEVIWKVVPELAEELIGDEIARLRDGLAVILRKAGFTRTADDIRALLANEGEIEA